MTLTRSGKYMEQTTLSFDANSTNSVTVALDIKENMDIAWSVLEQTGSHTTHVLTLQRSTDNVNWGDTNSTITAGTAYTVNVGSSSPVRYIRIKCTTAEGGASTVDIVINAK